MLIGLIFRGVAFEFRFKAERRAGAVGGTRPSPAARALATFFQGVMLGAFIDGIPVRDGAYAGGALDWLAPFSIVHRRSGCSSPMRCSAAPG